MLGRSVAKITDHKPARSKPEPPGRERLKHFDAEIGKALVVIAEIEAQCSRFEDIIADAATNQQALQKAIAADGGKALQAYAAGRGDDATSRLVMLAENSARAATAAKTALPAAQAALDNARQQLASLNEQRAAELNRVLANLGDVEARAYLAAFNEMSRLHDRLVGFAQLAQANQGDIQLIVDQVKTPRFALPSLGNSDADPFLRHRINDGTVAKAAMAYATARERLERDASADVSDLI